MWNGQFFPRSRLPVSSVDVTVAAQDLCEADHIPDENEWLGVIAMRQNLSGIWQVPAMTFAGQYVLVHWPEDSAPLSRRQGDTNAISYRRELIRFIVSLNKRGYAHGALTPDRVWVSPEGDAGVAWGNYRRDRAPLRRCRDLVGPGPTIFSTVNGVSTADLLGLRYEDFFVRQG